LLTEMFDRWIVRQKIGLLKSELAHAKDENTKHVLEEELAAEQKTLQKTYEHEQTQQNQK
jgi:hypothetical protein